MPKLYPVKRVLDERTVEKVREYLLDWEGVNPKTGKPWKPSWKPEGNLNEALLHSWKVQKAREKISEGRTLSPELGEPNKDHTATPDSSFSLRGMKIGPPKKRKRRASISTPVSTQPAEYSRPSSLRLSSAVASPSRSSTNPLARGDCIEDIYGPEETFLEDDHTFTPSQTPSHPPSSFFKASNSRSASLRSRMKPKQKSPHVQTDSDSGSGGDVEVGEKRRSLSASSQGHSSSQGSQDPPKKRFKTLPVISVRKLRAKQSFGDKR